MRSVSKATLSAIAVLLLVMPGTSASGAAPSGGITVAPAALQLDLKEGSQQASKTFTIRNNYPATVTLRFSLETPTSRQQGGQDVRSQITIRQQTLELAAEQEASQMLTVSDSDKLQPGSQQADLVISQQGTAATGVGILPSMRLPVTVIKYNGAVTSLGLTHVASPGFAMDIPTSVTITLKNEGNMVAIPRGTVRIVSPSGTVVGKGVLNESSKAVVPGGTLQLTTSFTSLAGSMTPGDYRIVTEYGAGGDTASRTQTTTFIYVAWWHAALMTLIAMGGWALYRYGRQLRTRRLAAKKKPKRQLLIGRDIT